MVLISRSQREDLWLDFISGEPTVSDGEMMEIFCMLSSEHYMPQSSAVAAAAGGGGGGLYLDAYEVSFPLEGSMERPPTYHLNPGQQMMDGTPHVLHMTTAVMITVYNVVQLTLYTSLITLTLEQP